MKRTSFVHVIVAQVNPSLKSGVLRVQIRWPDIDLILSASARTNPCPLIRPVPFIRIPLIRHNKVSDLNPNWEHTTLKSTPKDWIVADSLDQELFES